jgi:uncharacterized protein YdhG (YjbR/CyaY superfamily)
MKRRTSATNVDDYLAAVPVRARAALDKLRKAIRAAAPKATEGISYQIPIFKLGSPLVGFAAFENHCSFFVMSPAVMKAHKQDLKPYDTSTGTIRFAVNKPLPASLIKKLVTARIAENDARAKSKQRAKARK